MTSWEIVSVVLKQMRESARAGMNCLVLASVAEDIIARNNAVAFNKNYHPPWAKTPFPASICIGVNSDIAHAIPKDYVLKDGDTVSFDVSVKKDGLCADAGFTMGIGMLSAENTRLLEVARMTLDAGVKRVKAGVSIFELSKVMWGTAYVRGFYVFPKLTGHGIGREMHMLPTIPSTIPQRPLRRTELPLFYQYLKAGQMICLEPYVTKNDTSAILSEDGWTQTTKNNENAAFFETQLLVTDNGYELLTTHLL